VKIRESPKGLPVVVFCITHSPQTYLTSPNR
jgi:hypothetical protein